MATTVNFLISIANVTNEIKYFLAFLWATKIHMPPAIFNGIGKFRASHYFSQLHSRNSIMNIRTVAIRIAKSLFFNTPLYKHFLPVMKFDMTVGQLNLIIESMRGVSGDGVVLEIGVGGGATSVMINHAIKYTDPKRKYIAIDTFSGFTNEDISYENNVRGKNSNYQFYKSNSKQWFKKTLVAHGINDAVVIESDCKNVNYHKIGPIAFCLFDVDLYLPTKEVLPILYDHLIPGGIIIVDDCDPLHPIYDGAGQAYREFCEHVGLPPEIVHQKLGIIRKPYN